MTDPPPPTERQRLEDDHLSTSLRFFGLPLEMGPNDRGLPFEVGHIQATMYLPVPGFEPTSSGLLGECVTHWATAAATDYHTGPQRQLQITILGRSSYRLPYLATVAATDYHIGPQRQLQITILGHSSSYRLPYLATVAATDYHTGPQRQLQITILGHSGSYRLPYWATAAATDYHRWVKTAVTDYHTGPQRQLQITIDGSKPPNDLVWLSR